MPLSNATATMKMFVIACSFLLLTVVTAEDGEIPTRECEKVPGRKVERLKPETLSIEVDCEEEQGQKVCDRGTLFITILEFQDDPKKDLPKSVTVKITIPVVKATATASPICYPYEDCPDRCYGFQAVVSTPPMGEDVCAMEIGFQVNRDDKGSDTEEYCLGLDVPTKPGSKLEGKPAV